MAIKTAAELKAYFETGDVPTQQEFVDLIDTIFSGIPTYKNLVGLLSESELKELENTIGTLTFTHVGTGHYRISSSGLFTLDKTFVQISATSVVSAPNITYYITDSSTIDIYAMNSSNVLTDGLLSEDNTYSSILIKVYP